MGRSFLGRLQEGPILFDGAMGTELYHRGNIPFDRNFDELNLSNPEIVKGVHLDYIRAGAQVIETNTFGANRLRLVTHGLADKVRQVNLQGVAIAREASRLAGAETLVAAAMGPLGKPLSPLGPVSLQQAREAFLEQAGFLAEAGPDLLIMETFGDLRELREAILAARQVSDLPIVAQLTLTTDGKTPSGDTLVEGVEALQALNVQAIGLNCSIGPQPMLQAAHEMLKVAHLPLAMQPNAGFPSLIDGRYLYLSSPDYFADYCRQMVEAGVAIIGGCCGTTPRHVDALRKALASVRLRRHVFPSAAVQEQEEEAPQDPRPIAPTRLAQRVGQKFLVTVEVDPPQGFDASGTLRKLESLVASGLVDTINVADNSRAQTRMSALATCLLIQTRLGIETIMHLTTRHRNLVALHSELLGAHALGVRNVLCIMGDPPQIGDYPKATAIADITPSGLVGLIKSLNQGVTLTGKPVDQPTSFFVGCALNLNAQGKDQDRELKVLERKIEAGADFIMAQPVYDPEVVRQWHQRLGGFPRPLLLGVLPLRNHRHAEFLHNEVPGISIPSHVVERLRQAPKPGEEGLQVAVELLEQVHPLVAGVYLMAPFGRYSVLLQLLRRMERFIPNLAAPAHLT
ncbi:MAG: bifunctional homocysteine S-methyltransferase/methylenetetrahydrofolate reductase [Dehalococcoidia bacterium]|nr:bifunctional homocysteine S-methyltransferase/methylenetetrahydrofolate reductase [Dehalococcoidia bacterium]